MSAFEHEGAHIHTHIHKPLISRMASLFDKTKNLHRERQKGNYFLLPRAMASDAVL